MENVEDMDARDTLASEQKSVDLGDKTESTGSCSSASKVNNSEVDLEQCDKSVSHIAPSSARSEHSSEKDLEESRSNTVREVGDAEVNVSGSDSQGMNKTENSSEKNEDQIVSSVNTSKVNEAKDFECASVLPTTNEDESILKNVESESREELDQEVISSNSAQKSDTEATSLNSVQKANTGKEAISLNSGQKTDTNKEPISLNSGQKADTDKEALSLNSGQKVDTHTTNTEFSVSSKETEILKSARKEPEVLLMNDIDTNVVVSLQNLQHSTDKQPSNTIEEIESGEGSNSGCNALKSAPFSEPSNKEVADSSINISAKPEAAKTDAISNENAADKIEQDPSISHQVSIDAEQPACKLDTSSKESPVDAEQHACEADTSSKESPCVENSKSGKGNCEDCLTTEHANDDSSHQGVECQQSPVHVDCVVDEKESESEKDSNKLQENSEVTNIEENSRGCEVMQVQSPVLSPKTSGCEITAVHVEEKSDDACTSETVSNDISKEVVCISETASSDISKEACTDSKDEDTTYKHDESRNTLDENIESKKCAVSSEGKCAPQVSDNVDSSINVCSSGKNVSCDEGNVDKDIEAVALADVDNVCNEDSVDHADEEDPFLSCNDKNKETDLHVVSDDQERETTSPIEVDHIDDESLDKDERSKSPACAEGGDSSTSCNDTAMSIGNDDIISAVDDSSSTAERVNAVDNISITDDNAVNNSDRPFSTSGIISNTDDSTITRPFSTPDNISINSDAINSSDKQSSSTSNSAEGSAVKVVDVASTAEDVTLNSADAANTSKDTNNTAEEITVVEAITDEKSSAGDEELCIVPDTAPRVPTDKEKADAVEKAAKVSVTPSKEDPSAKATEMIENPDADKEVQNESDPKDLSSQEDVQMDDAQISLPSESNKVPKTPLIHVVSTASLLDQSQSEDAEKETAADKDSSELTKEQTCCQCSKVMKCKYKIKDKENTYVCEDDCYAQYRKKNHSGRCYPASSVTRPSKPDRVFVHTCAHCKQQVDTSIDKTLTWETMDFCNEDCLEKYQKAFGSHCANCKGPVQTSSLGKYCVRFGYDMKQFCLASCLEDFKKGLKVCSYCQKDISSGTDGFLAPVGDKGQFKDFCSPICMEKYDQMSNNTAPPETTHECAVCYNLKVVKVEVIIDSKVQKLCSEPCFAAFKFVNAIVADQCDMCKKYFDRNKTENFTVFYDDAPHSFCCKTCMNVYILAKRKIVPCTWCKVKKYNFDMIKRALSSGQVLMMCSLHCMSLYQVSVTAAATKKVKCDKCSMISQAQYHLTMSDATIRNFCSNNCVMAFQSQFSKPPIPVPGAVSTPHPLGNPRRVNARRSTPVNEKDASKPSAMPIISSVKSLAASNGQPTAVPVPTALCHTAAKPSNETVKTVYKQQIIIKPPPPPDRQNRVVQVKPLMYTKGVSCRPHAASKETQTEEHLGSPALIPIPVPIFIPAPMHMFSTPYPVPIPFPLPIPVPVFIPTTRNSAKGIFKEIKRIQEKIPSDPFEAEMLMMAEMVAGEKKVDNTDTESEDDEDQNTAEDIADAAEPESSPEAPDTSNALSEDMLQIALKIASEMDEPAVDFEAAVAPSTISQPASQQDQQADQNDVTESEANDSESEVRAPSVRKRTLRSSSKSCGVPQKRGRRSSGSESSNVGSLAVSTTSEPTTQSKVEQAEKPDVNMCLKFTFGVNAWKHWVTQKNAELEKAAGNSKKIKLFKTELLHYAADELNYSLCLFVKEVKKPNGSEYAPDTIYYLCLGIQQYLLENGRLENIFVDPYYEKFTECLDEVARKFTVLYNDTQFIVTRVEEEHLWESKQLGAVSPYVLLSTLMFFNTKHFNLGTVEEHMQLSFSHIMKHWKRHSSTPINSKTPGSRNNVLLRFYPPQASLAGNSKKKKVYEQQANEENPLRCPVKLYEFYLLKCPESVKTRNDVFYLLPERSCVDDSPVWYSTMALGRDQLQKMLHRIKMVKEINVALLNG